MGEANDPDHNGVIAAEELFEEVKAAVANDSGCREEAWGFLEFFEVVDEDEGGGDGG